MKSLGFFSKPTANTFARSNVHPTSDWMKMKPYYGTTCLRKQTGDISLQPTGSVRGIRSLRSHRDAAQTHKHPEIYFGFTGIKAFGVLRTT